MKKVFLLELQKNDRILLNSQLTGYICSSGVHKVKIDFKTAEEIETSKTKSNYPHMNWFTEDDVFSVHKVTDKCVIVICNERTIYIDRREKKIKRRLPFEHNKGVMVDKLDD